MALKARAAASLTVDATAGGVSLPSSIRNDSNIIIVKGRLETAQIRFQPDPSVTITSGGSEGSPLLEVGEEIEIAGSEDIQNIKFIRTGTTSGALRLVGYGTGQT